jgi:hypothetical protein
MSNRVSCCTCCLAESNLVVTVRLYIIASLLLAIRLRCTKFQFTQL